MNINHWAPRIYLASVWLGFGFFPGLQAAPATETLGDHLQVTYGAVNSAFLERNGKRLAVYGGAPSTTNPVDTVLFTHYRRDVVWAGTPLAARGAKAVGPERERDLFTQVESFWSKFRQARFHDYAQPSTKVLRESLPLAKTVRDEQSFLWEDVPIKVLDTPGYTRGSVTYLLENEGKKIAFTGDLICGDGRLFDLYSLQDAIPEAKIGGYHGYAARLADVVASLRKVAAEKPTVLVPARGPIIPDPQVAIDRLIKRIEIFYANYLSIDALRWYFKDEHIRTKAKRVLGPAATVDWMPMAETFPNRLPAWIVAIDNSRLICATDGAGFLVDCGGLRIIEELKKRRDAGNLTSVDGVFITHYHDDHTDQVPALVKTFNSTVYACRGMNDLLAKPSAYRLPCLTANSIVLSGPLADRATWRWKEFEFTAYYFPGQTLYHDALLVKKDGGETIFFIGDSFTPSGIDDYCLQNRNFLHEGMGYFKCLDLVAQLPSETWLINQHVEPAFRFSRSQIETMNATLKDRLKLLSELTPWDDPNFALDEGWARFYPYASTVHPGETAQCALKLMNHSADEQTYQVNLNLPKGWSLSSITPNPISIAPEKEGALEARFALPGDCPPGLYIVTADLRWAKGDLHEWTEAMITVAP